jgi:hypothetical protein
MPIEAAMLPSFASSSFYGLVSPTIARLLEERACDGSCVHDSAIGGAAMRSQVRITLCGDPALRERNVACELR